MSSPKVIHSRIQHGVGQGSFHSAKVEFCQGGQKHRFDYVYDCGALAGRWPTKALKHSVNRLSLEPRQSGPKSKARIDLVVLSHFDQDHMNGIEMLVRRFDVGRVMLPYLDQDEFLLLIASGAITESETVRAVHQLVDGEGSLFGVPVTRIKRGARQDNSPAAEDQRGAQQGLPEAEVGVGHAPDLPQSMAIETADGQTLGLDCNDDQYFQIKPGSISCIIWQFRFWNRGKNEGLCTNLKNELAAIECPINSSNQDRLALEQFLDWLKVKANKRKLTGAFEKAVKSIYPNLKLKKGDVPNFISLAMYSAPAFEAERYHVQCRRAVTGYCVSGCFCWRPWLIECRDAIGWLGTGDAPLGEEANWQDFERHYKNELPRTHTVLVPHHGAAPASGLSYFNPGLIAQRGVTAVISFGAHNSYGHPKAKVIEQIMEADGELLLVTELSEIGFHEHFVFEKK